MRDREPTETALLACITGTGLPDVLCADSTREGHLTNVLLSARHHQVTGYLDRALQAIGPDAGHGSRSVEEEAVRGWLQRAAAMTAIQQLTALADLRSVDEAFSAASLPWCVIKGPVLAERVYPEPTLRPSRDLDVVVPAAAFGAAIAALERNGATLLDANWDLAIGQRRGQVHVRLPHGTTADLHWHLANAGRVRDTLDISMPPVWHDLRAVMIQDLSVRTLSVTGTVVHTGLHAALGGAWRLRWLNDLALVIAHEPVDWAAVLFRARQWRASRLLGVALLRSALLLNADVPDEVIIDLLGSRACRDTAKALDHRWSPASDSGLAPARLWPQFVRETWSDTLRTVTWRARRRVGNGLRGYSYGRNEPEMMTPSRGGDGRARYLRLVERGALDVTRRARRTRVLTRASVAPSG